MWKSAKAKGIANDALIMSAASDWASFMISSSCTVHQVKYQRIMGKCSEQHRDVRVTLNALAGEQFTASSKRWAIFSTPGQ